MRPCRNFLTKLTANKTILRSKSWISYKSLVSFVFFKIVLDRNLNNLSFLKSYSIASRGRDFIFLQSFNIMWTYTTITVFMLLVAYAILGCEFQFLCRSISTIFLPCFINRVVMLDIVGIDAFCIQIGSFFIILNRCYWYCIEQSFLINKILSGFFWKWYSFRKCAYIII